MKPTHDMSTGETALIDLISSMPVDSKTWNEADTRHHFIDILIHEVLGWGREVTSLERHEGGEYSDYELGKPPEVVIEAKRAGVGFEIPHEGTASIVRSIRSLTSMSKEFKAAFEQAISYCSRRGIQIGVVSNSSQVIVFLGVRTDGVPLIDGKCLVFGDHTALLEHFPRLWQAISPSAVQRRELLKELTSIIPSGVPAKLSSYISGYPSFRYPSDSQQSLRMLSDLLIEDAPNTPEYRKKFLEECYCESGALARDALLGKNILAARYAAMFPPTEQSPSLKGVKRDASDRFGISQEVVAEALGRRPIVIIGDVGVGKTSFIRNLIYVRAADEMKNAVYIYIDLGSQANLGQDIHEFLIEEIERQLIDNYAVDLFEDTFVRGVYHGEIKRFEKGIYGRLKDSAPEKFIEKQIELLEELTKNRVLHLQKCIQHLSKGRQKQVVLSIDNADQRELRDQQRAFLAAQEFASIWQALVLVSIRPRTYFASKNAGSISAYPQRILTISPPRVDLVLEKRLKFSLDLAEGRLPLDRLDGITIRLDSIALFLRALIYSLKNAKELGEFMSNITGGNIREVLELIKGIIGSPNVDSDKIITIMENDGEYIIPLHEFTKAALLGEYSHYDSKSSLALNLFDVRYPDKREHFLCLILVSYLGSDTPGKSTEGFVPTQDICAELGRFGFVVDQVEHALRRLTNKKLIETTERVTFDEGLQGLVGDMPIAFRVTTIGSYHCNRWASTFAYMDAMLVDTPILDPSLRQDISRRIDSFDISERLRRTEIFDLYLLKCWSELSEKPVYFDWPTVRASGNRSFDSVRRAVDKKGNR
jgi:GTPase SAR1 family protein